MSSWTPASGPHLTQEEEEMLTFPNDVVRTCHYAYKDCHGRIVILTIKDADTISSTSSYVFLNQPDDSILLGQTAFFFTYFLWHEH